MSSKGKCLILTALCVVFTVLCFTIGTYEAVADENLIRFHVIANSDTVYDQNIKLKVRDRVLEEIRPFLEDAENTEDAGRILRENQEKITQTANEVLKEEN